MAGMLIAWLVILLVANQSWLAAHYSPPRTIAEVTRVLVGVPVCAVGALLLADRYAHRLGAVVMAAGGLWLIPSALTDMFSLVGGGRIAAGAAVVLHAFGAAARPLTVLLCPFVLSGDVPRWWRRGVIMAAVCCYLVYAVVWAIGTPGADPYPSPWAESGAGEWVRAAMDEHWGTVLTWLRRGVTVAVTAGLCMAVATAATRRQWVGRSLLIVVYLLLVLLLLSEVWTGDTAVLTARVSGAVAWAAVLCIAVIRGQLWRVDRATGHRLAAAFVATVTGAILLTAAAQPWAPMPETVAASHVSLGCALVVGWLARPVTERATGGVERLFYGPRARPREAVQALTARLRQAPSPEDVPEQICRSAVEDLGLSGAAVTIDTATGSHELATAGSPIIGPAQHFPLHYHGRTIGRLTVARDPASTPMDRDTDVLTLLADQAAPALAALGLAEQARVARERLVLAREEERRHLRREIHDGLGPLLAAVQLRIGTAQADSPRSAVAERHLGTAANQLSDALAEVRRITTGLAPAALIDRTLPCAVADLADRLGTAATAISVHVSPAEFPELPAGVEVAAYRIVSEAVTNAVRHADARHIEISLDVATTVLTISISDDGQGLPDHPRHGSGLASLVDRAEEIGGGCTIGNTPQGMSVHATLPITI
ncbi:hypothetical protein GCM10027167_48130 [Nocardia heshunensis]